MAQTDPGSARHPGPTRASAGFVGSVSSAGSSAAHLDLIPTPTAPSPDPLTGGGAPY